MFSILIVTHLRVVLVYSTCGILSFLELWLFSVYQIQKNFSHYLLKYCIFPYPHHPAPQPPQFSDCSYKQIRILHNILWSNGLFSSFFFFSQCSVWAASIFLSLSSLIFSSICLICRKTQYCAFFTIDTVFFFHREVTFQFFSIVSISFNIMFRFSLRSLSIFIIVLKSLPANSIILVILFQLIWWVCFY